MKLNLGCGGIRIAGWHNVDKEATAATDALADLESCPWPWPDNSVDEVLFNHSLEHMGGTPDGFIAIMRELWRVCAHGALIHINVPHPRHDNFIGDPTHVRVITPQVMSLFSKKNCLHWAQIRASNTPLALYANVDFEMVDTHMILDEPWASQLEQGMWTSAEIERAVHERNNVCNEIRMVLRALKPGTPGDPSPA